MSENIPGWSLYGFPVETFSGNSRLHPEQAQSITGSDSFRFRSSIGFQSPFMSTNPCAELSLENYELCSLSTINPFERISNMIELEILLKICEEFTRAILSNRRNIESFCRNDRLHRDDDPTIILVDEIQDECPAFKKKRGYIADPKIPPQHETRRSKERNKKKREKIPYKSKYLRKFNKSNICNNGR
jgi:hypothetical protein